MTANYCLEVTTREGVVALSRIVNVLALLDITPQEIRGHCDGEGMRIRLQFDAEPRQAALCQARLGVMAAVESLASCAVA